MLNINPWCCEDLAATSNHFILFNLSNVMFECHVLYYMTSSFIWLDIMPNYDTKNFTLFNQQLKTIYNQNTLPKLLEIYVYCKKLSMEKGYEETFVVYNFLFWIIQLKKGGIFNTQLASTKFYIFWPLYTDVLCITFNPLKPFTFSTIAVWIQILS